MSKSDLAVWKPVTLACLVACGFGCEKEDPVEMDAAHTDAAAPDAPAPDAPEAGDAAEGDGSDAPGAVRSTLTILHTNDLHSHLMGHAPEADYTPATKGDDETVAGFARLAWRVSRERQAAAQEGRALMLVDSGDFTMGTLFELLGPSAAPELRLMDALGYDAVTLGNHEFDWTPRGLAGTLQAARTAGVKVPIVASNMKLDPTSTADDGLEALVQAGMIRSKLVKTIGGLKVGFFGLMGKNAVSVTPTMKPVTFEDLAPAATRLVKELRETDGVDLVIALSHAGIHEDGKGEDEALARAVPGIDVIVSGHTHHRLTAPVKVGGTLIVNAGAFGAYLGRLNLDVVKPPQGPTQVMLGSYALLTIDDSEPGAAETQTAIDAFIKAIDGALMPAGLAYRKVVAETAFDLGRTGLTDTPVGNLVTDAYRAVTTALDPMRPVDIAVEANGSIRARIAKGKTGQIWFADLFRVLPLGIGPDGKPGYPLIAVYLNGKDLRAGMELAAAADVLGSDNFLQISGLEVDHDPTRPMFARVTAMRSTAPGRDPQSIDPNDTTRCYRVATTALVGGFFGLVKSLTGGQLAVQPKDSDCTTVLPDVLAKIVDADSATAGVQELKAWQAFTSYVGKLPDTNANGTPDVPAPYATTMNRWRRAGAP